MSYVLVNKGSLDFLYDLAGFKAKEAHYSFSGETG